MLPGQEDRRPAPARVRAVPGRGREGFPEREQALLLSSSLF